MCYAESRQRKTIVNTSEDVIAESFVDYWWDTERTCRRCYNGEPFGEAFDDVYVTIEDAIQQWISKTGIEQGDHTNEQMIEFINGCQYDNEETYFYIHPLFYTSISDY